MVKQFKRVDPVEKHILGTILRSQIYKEYKEIYKEPYHEIKETLKGQISKYFITMHKIAPVDYDKHELVFVLLICS